MEDRYFPWRVARVLTPVIEAGAQTGTERVVVLQDEDEKPMRDEVVEVGDKRTDVPSDRLGMAALTAMELRVWPGCRWVTSHGFEMDRMGHKRDHPASWEIVQVMDARGNQGTHDQAVIVAWRDGPEAHPLVLVTAMSLLAP